MSFILDALKKSENERQKASGPALFEVKVAPPASRFPVWAVVVGVLLGVNLIVLGAVLLLRDEADPAVQATNAQIAANTTAPAGTAPGIAPAPTAIPGLAPSAAPAPTDAAQPTLGPDGLPVAGARPEATAVAGPTRFNTPLVEEDPALTDEPAYSPRGAPINPADYQPATAGQTPPLASPGAYGPPGGANRGAGPARSPGSAQTSGVPSRDDLVAAGQGGIPEANVSLHVYDKNPAARFVFVNGQRAKEGDVLANGIRVDEIRADGAVLSFAGSRFLVPIR